MLYTYDALNRLKNIQDFQQLNYGFGYDNLSRRTSLTRPNSINTTYAYDPQSRLTSILHKLATTTLDGATYTYDNAGNRLTRTDKRTNVTLSYTSYDNIYELQTVKQGATTKESYTYDPVGNRLSSLGVSPYTYNSGNWLTSIPGTTYNYDNNGSLTSKTDGTAYSWDYENRLTQVTLPGSGGTVNLKYDPFGRRIQKAFTQGSTTTTNYVYDGANAIEEVDGNGAVLARYTQGLGIDEPLAELRSGTTSYYQADGLGSITSLSNTAGALANTYTYDSFGKLTASSGTIVNPFQFTGRDFDSETGLRYYRTRYYDQNIGRFTSEDRSRFKGGINLYTYVGNDATNLTDPNGTAFKTCAKALADLLAAQFLASERLAAYLRHADWDPHHANSLGQALTNLQRALDQVKKFCKCDPTAPAIIALATALVAEIVDALRQVCSEEPEICYAWI